MGRPWLLLGHSECTAVEVCCWDRNIHETVRQHLMGVTDEGLCMCWACRTRIHTLALVLPVLNGYVKGGKETNQEHAAD